MSYVEKIKKYKLQIITAVLYLITVVYKQEMALYAAQITFGYLKEMIQILPAVFIISGLITIWVPKEVVMKNFGKESGFKGKTFSILMGSVSAGPIYAAFPVAFSLLSKGASISNVVVIISAWAVVKIPMLLVEAKFLSLNFMMVRALFTIPAILLVGYITGRLVKEEDVMANKDESDFRKNIIIQIESVLPHYDCGGCGYKNCRRYAEDIVAGKSDIDQCSVGGEEVQERIQEILRPISLE